MLRNLPEVPQHLLLAFDHHQRLVEEASRQRMVAAAAGSKPKGPLGWQRVRLQLGTLLISLGQRLKMSATDAVWG